MAKQGWQDAFAFNVTGQFGSRYSTGCGVQVHRDANEVTARAGLDPAGPDGAGRHFQPAFVHVLFAAAMMAVRAADVDLAAVVAAENRQRVFVLAVLFQGIDHLADAVVHVLYERDQLGPFGADARLAGLHFFEPIGRRLDRRVRRVVGEVHEKRLLLPLAAIHVIDAPLGDQVGGMAGRIDLPAVFPEVIDAVTPLCVVGVDHVAEKALEIVKIMESKEFEILVVNSLKKRGKDPYKMSAKQVENEMARLFQNEDFKKKFNNLISPVFNKFDKEFDTYSGTTTIILTADKEIPIKDLIGNKTPAMIKKDIKDFIKMAAKEDFNVKPYTKWKFDVKKVEK